MSKKHLIIGTGPAALSAAETIRGINPQDEIMLVSKEDCLPYSPAALPYVLAGRITENGLFNRDAGYFVDRHINITLAKEVIRIIPGEKNVIYHNGEKERYDNLLIASGATSMVQNYPGVNESDLVIFHTLRDMRRLTSMLKPDNMITILGAGMVAIEVAVALAEAGYKVMILSRSRPLRMYFSEVVGDCIKETLSEHGIEIKTGKIVSTIRKNANGYELRCADGEIFYTNLVISCLGIKPDLSIAQATSILINQGILVDRKMRTSLDGIYAAGDVVEAPSFISGQPGICAILPEAVAQGQVAGMNMAGQECIYPGWVPANLLQLFGHLAFSVGTNTTEISSNQVLEEIDQRARRYKRLVFSDGRLIGAAFLDVEIDPGVILYLIKNRLVVDRYSQALFEDTANISRWLMLKAEKNMAI